MEGGGDAGTSLTTVISWTGGALTPSVSSAVASSTNNTRVADEYLRAVMLAESVLAANRSVTEANLSLSDAHDKYDWELRAWPVQQSQYSVNEKLGENVSELNFLSVTVSWPSGDMRRRIDLLSIVPIRVGVE